VARHHLYEGKRSIAAPALAVHPPDRLYPACHSRPADAPYPPDFVGRGPGADGAIQFRALSQTGRTFLVHCTDIRVRIGGFLPPRLRLPVKPSAPVSQFSTALPS